MSILRTHLRSALAGTLVLVVAACSHGQPEPLLTPVPQEPADSAGSPAPFLEPVAADSAADAEALDALRDLEFSGLAKGASHLRGTIVAPDMEDGAITMLELTSSSRGGAASATRPTYDIDVESFATHARVEYYLNYFLGPARDRFGIWLGRLNRYEGMIRERFRSVGVPEDMVYLALIESGYSNTAVSRANAVGMWQFMSYTASQYGLRVDDWVDERRDPFKATDAAARYLADHQELFGSWYLAAAAYNGGRGRVSRGLRRLSRAGDSATSDTTFFKLSDRRYLRRETRDYVPKLIAAALIAKDPGRYAFHRIQMQSPLEFDEITVAGATGLDVLARLADTTARAMVELNPQYYRGVTPPSTTSIVRVPRGSGIFVSGRYAALPPDERVNFLTHKIRRGETLSLIGKRYGVSVRQLRAANRGVRARSLRVGSRLVIPVSPTARLNPGTAPSSLRGRARYHTVRWGESLSVIARRYGVSVRNLQEWNGMRDADKLRAGTRLVVTPR